MNALCRDDEVVDEFLHLGKHGGFLGEDALRIVAVDRARRKFVHDLAKDLDAFADFLHANKVAVVAIPGGTDRDIEIVVLIIQVRVFLRRS